MVVAVHRRILQFFASKARKMLSQWSLMLVQTFGHDANAVAQGTSTTAACSNGAAANSIGCGAKCQFTT